MKHTSLISSTLRSLFRGWAVSFGACALIMGTSHFINKSLLPVLVLIVAYLLGTYMRSVMSRSGHGCSRVVWTVKTTLVLAAFVMFGLVLAHNPHLFGNRFNAPYFNPRIPYVSGIVIFTCGAVMSGYALFMGRSLGVCRKCRKMYGEYEDDTLAASLFDAESAHQLRLFCWISVVVAAAQWAYYYVFFINVNYNTPDLFFFNYMPVAVYVLSLVYLGSRYYNITEAYNASVADGAPGRARCELRFIVTSGDSMLLREQGEGEWDTPYKAEVGAAGVDERTARVRFDAMGGSEDTTLRYLYTNNGRGGDTTVHYAAFVPEESKGGMLRGGSWMSLYDVDRYLHSGRIAPVLANELMRIHTVTMAWKTYDRQGRRLYPIKHYKPIFRLQDFKDWDVDYSDPVWLQVSMENEDTPFFRARRLWRKCHSIFNRR
ncbi:MAG: hypothetical protein K2L27_06085 [Muribaculaceae bacterium]|nr:hypothetical protein [Muribaculaceae bacterium]